MDMEVSALLHAAGFYKGAVDGGLWSLDKLWEFGYFIR
jgi:hypothetical protein